MRFELAYYALKPDVTVIAPWREWDLRSREQLIAFAEQHQIPIAKDKRGEAPFSVDANLLHASSEGKVLEDPAQEVPDYVYSRTDRSGGRARQADRHHRRFREAATRSRSTARSCRPRSCSTHLNELGRANGIGRLDLVENRFVGMKSRGMYETPGGTILLAAHRGIESITLDRGAAHLKDELMPKYAELIYNGFWFAPEREMLQAAIDKSQELVTGRVRLKLYKGNVAVVGRESPYSLYDQDLVTFEEGAVAYDHRDAAGFIRLNALRLRTLGQRKKKLKLEVNSSPPACGRYLWRAEIGNGFSCFNVSRYIGSTSTLAHAAICSLLVDWCRSCHGAEPRRADRQCPRHRKQRQSGSFACPLVAAGRAGTLTGLAAVGRCYAQDERDMAS